MVTCVIARCIIVTIGTLYPAYKSYKALMTSDLKAVVNCLRYWIVFAIFIAVETITDIILSWFPFYYWMKICVVLWMISPAGSTFIYKRFVQPVLKEREKEIDELLERTKEKGYSTLIELGHKSFRYASTLFLNTAILSQAYLGEHLKRSLSTNDIIVHSQLQAYINKNAILEEVEDENDDDDLKARLDEDRQFLKSTPGQQQFSPYQISKDNTEGQLEELEMSNVIAQQKQRKTRASTVSNSKKSGAPYSSAENSHYGTISKGQAQQMLKRSKITNSVYSTPKVTVTAKSALATSESARTIDNIVESIDSSHIDDDSTRTGSN
ncbi:unnamed protein product [Didymodactylos carnosus]|uniref:Receptor expression-enhancing protein n=2 Tax=Didymodactylos carnosus TaxID=1234261 RepID=A0A814PRT3_9BILA|nr:unnamed protein product [Didymodactylos carnosus]CAF3874324.1 unnamed protein product [Didymodactylos carnosus]